MLRLLQSNRLEVLARELGRALDPAPLQPQTIVVPHRDMARWLWITLAAQRGIAANLDCVLPGSFVWRVFHRVLDDVPENSPYDPDVLLWRLVGLLHAARGDEALAGLGSWRDTDDELRRLQLARALAEQFDQYIVYRPDMLGAWQRGENGGWQAELWRRLRSATAAPDWTTLRARLDQVDARAVRAALPGSVAVFGLPLLSPGYLEVLAWLGRAIDVTLYLPNPASEYWGDIVAERDLGRRAGVEDERELYLESGNPLLASLGKQARDLIDLLHDEPALEVVDCFETPQGEQLLPSIQRQVLQLEEPARLAADRAEISGDDRTLQVHVCHSPRREVEVLHDQLLAMFDADATLSAGDVMVMAPDIDSYAPYVEAVFGTADLIPYRVADRDPRARYASVDAFLALLELPRERFDANEVLAVLEAPPVQRRFGIAASDVGRMREWLRATGVRRDLATAPDGEASGTWRHGLDRLLLGFALPGARNEPFAGVLPADEADGTDALVLGALAEFVARLGRLDAAARTPARWSDWLMQLLDEFLLAGPDDERELQLLRNACEKLAVDCAAAGLNIAIGFDVVRDWLQATLSSAGSRGGFLGHGVTFANLVPMRNVPARVVCLLGLDDGQFPRQQARRSFDLIASEPRRGDRSRREDDRLAFLESLLNARDVFYLSYSGRDERDDTESPPSVVVTELLDYCERNFAGVAGSDSIAVVHPLHPFSRRYFDASDERLFSYSDLYCAAARSTATEMPPLFLDGALGQPAEVDARLFGEALDIETLVAFFKKPAKFLLRERLQIVYGEDAEPLDTRDPYERGGLTEWQLREHILQSLMQGHDRESALALACHSRFAAPGALGRVLLRRCVAEMDRFYSELQALWPSEPRAHLPVAAELDDGVVSGVIRLHDRAGQFIWRQGKTRPSDRLEVWLRHLLLCAAAPADIEPVTRWYSTSGSLSYRPAANAAVILADLVALFRETLREPQPVLPQAGWEYYKAYNAGDAGKALEKAAAAYRLREGGGDGDARYTYRLFGPDPDFERVGELARRIFAPLHAHLEEAET